MLFSSTKADWLGNVRRDLIAGLVVALALIPEAIAFSYVASSQLFAHSTIHLVHVGKMDESFTALWQHHLRDA